MYLANMVEKSDSKRGRTEVSEEGKKPGLRAYTC